MHKLFSTMMFVAISAGATSIAFADTAPAGWSSSKPGAQPQCQVAQLQDKVSALTREVAALQAQTETMPAASENVIDDLATGG